MKKNWYRRISIILAAFLLLVILPISAMAEKRTDGKVVTGASLVKASDSNISRRAATPSDASRRAATPSDAKRKETLLVNDLKPEKPSEEQLSGTWAADETTVYRFRKDGTGALILPKNTYEFKYEVEDDELVLKFKDGRIGKAVFLFTLEDDTLVLKREDAGFAEVTLKSK